MTKRLLFLLLMIFPLTVLAEAPAILRLESAAGADLPGGFHGSGRGTILGRVRGRSRCQHGRFRRALG